MTSDRQTDHSTEKCVGIGGILDAATVIAPQKRGLLCSIISPNARQIVETS